MYEYKTRTRYSEYDENKRIRLKSLLSYLQDTSSYHSYDSGMTVDYYKNEHRAWLINFWDIYIEALPHDCEYMLCGTSPHDIEGLFAYRNFWLKSAEDGHYFLKADSVWFEVNTDTLKPIRPSADDITPFGESKNILDLRTPTRKVKFDKQEELKLIAKLPVYREMLDTNHHVNNIQYIGAAYHALLSSGLVSEDYFPTHIRAEYKHSAVYGDTFVISASATAESIHIAECSDDGREFCRLEFSMDSL